jgi:gamma-glutamyltranspeptidase/glutathione hydrolase
MRFFLWSGGVLRGLVVFALFMADGLLPGQAVAAQGVVSVSHPLAAAAGADLLAQGGNAIDAAAAIQFALNVVEPQSSGLGGGGFMMVYVAREQRIWIVDSRETAPAAATPGMFVAGEQPVSFARASSSGVSVGVPGTLAGVSLALRRWGTRSLAQTLTPAIALAEGGFRVNRFLADDIEEDAGRTAYQPETSALFWPRGKPLQAGDWLVQADLAKTLRLIARHGPAVFYRGEIARAIVRAQQRSRTLPLATGRGRMTVEDLAHYRPVVRAPLLGQYRGRTLATMPPPSSGGVTLLQILGLLQPLPLGDASQGYGPGSPRTLHAMTEAMRLAFADRAVWLGDADFVPVPVEGLLSPAYLRERGQLIQPGQRMPTPTAGDPGAVTGALPRQLPARATPEGVHTTHFSVADRWGNVVSYTSTIEQSWGSGITVPGYGFLLNNELTDFNFVPQRDARTGNPGANDIAPGKRPRSSMAPIMVLQAGQPIAAYGSPGGPTIINSVLNVTLNLLDHGLPMQAAIDAPRWSVTRADGDIQCEGGETRLFPAFSSETLDSLQWLGHTGLTEGCRARIGSVQAVWRAGPEARWQGAADARREGTVIRVMLPPAGGD